MNIFAAVLTLSVLPIIVLSKHLGIAKQFTKVMQMSMESLGVSELASGFAST